MNNMTRNTLCYVVYYYQFRREFSVKLEKPAVLIILDQLQRVFEFVFCFTVETGSCQ
jgi:hypothetical protein